MNLTGRFYQNVAKKIRFHWFLLTNIIKKCIHFSMYEKIILNLRILELKFYLLTSLIWKSNYKV